MLGHSVRELLIPAMFVTAVLGIFSAVLVMGFRGYLLRWYAVYFRISVALIAISGYRFQYAQAPSDAYSVVIWWNLAFSTILGMVLMLAKTFTDEGERTPLPPDD